MSGERYFGGSLASANVANVMVVSALLRGVVEAVA
jgi:hypothetical protein